jgi:hypothetical protein
MKLLRKISKDLIFVLLIALAIIPAVYRLVRPGYFVMQDDLQAFRIQQLDKCIDDNQIPCRWVPDAGYQYGYPQFNYYPPSVYYLGAILHKVGIQYIDAVKVLFVLGYLISAIAMYVLVNSLFKDRWTGFVSSILYTYIPYKAVEVYVRGALSEFWALSFFPIILWSLYNLIKTERKKYLIWFSVSTALLLITHTLMSMIFAPVAIIWALYWIIIEKKKLLNKDVIMGGLLGFGLSAFFILPVLFERSFVHVESILSGYFDYRQHFVSLFKIFLSREWGYGSSGFPNELLNLSTGTIQWIAGIFAVVLGAFNIKKNKPIAILAFVLGGLELFVLFMMHMKSSFIWTLLPMLHWLQFPWRFLSISILLLSILSGILIHFSGKLKYVLGAFLILAAVLLNISFFKEKEWLNISDQEKFSGMYWEKQLTISIFDYLPIYAKLPPIVKAPDKPEVLEGVAKFEYYEKGSNWQSGKVDVTTENARLRIPLFDFPGMTVTSDGKVLKHVNDDCRGQEFCLGLVTFDINKGEHNLRIELKDTPIRTIGNYLTVLSALYILYLLIKPNGKIS